MASPEKEPTGIKQDNAVSQPTDSQPRDSPPTESNQPGSSHDSVEKDAEAAQPEPAAEAPPRPTSRASSARSRALSIIPGNQKRGLLARLSFVPEVTRPKDYARSTKWIITIIVALAATASPLGSSILLPSLSDLAVDLNTSTTIGNLTVAVYALAMAIFPLWWSSFSETSGRRTIYILSFSLTMIFNVLSSVSVNVAMLIIMRVLAGGASASVQAVGAGTISDIWETRERGGALGIFYLGPLLGPLLAPIIGGALTIKWGWRSTMWFITIHGAVILLLIIFCLPETLDRKPPQDQQQLPQPNAAGEKPPPSKRVAQLKRFFIEPLYILVNLRYIPIATTVTISAATFASLFILNITAQAMYSKSPYSFSALFVGLLYIPSSLGYMVSSIFGGRWTDRIMHREARKANRYDDKGKLVFLPEDRMRENAWIGTAVYPGALIMFGWTLEKGLHWAVPSVGALLFGLGSMLVFSTSTTMLTEFMPKRSSSGIAINNFVRNIFSCIGAVIAQPLINAMGSGWLSTLVGLLAMVVTSVSMFSLHKFGPKWRVDMDRKMAAREK